LSNLRRLAWKRLPHIWPCVKNTGMGSADSGQQIRARIKIQGRVQGVYYRASMAQQATQLGIVGWVRNCEDGAVEAVAEGNCGAVDALLSWCRHGPAGARVDNVEVLWETAAGGFDRFGIRR
jgi:acylphosphatase